MTVDERSPTRCVWARFPERFPQCCVDGNKRLRDLSVDRGLQPVSVQLQVTTGVSRPVSHEGAIGAEQNSSNHQAKSDPLLLTHDALCLNRNGEEWVWMNHRSEIIVTIPGSRWDMQSYCCIFWPTPGFRSQKLGFLALGETCKAIFWPVPGLKGTTLGSSGFSVEGS